MKVYLCGGAVRDILLGRTPKDLDFAVEGASPEEMINLGFSMVGEDFPVFLHPETGDEFALCRVERKIGKGHGGFDCDWKGVSIEDDLSRRDLTINSMAIDLGLTHSAELKGLDLSDADFTTPVWVNNIIDPFGGRKDLENKVLRATTDAFREDPLRVLRLHRFRARLGSDWIVSDDTRSLCLSIFLSGELLHLTSERVFEETNKALKEPHPELFFRGVEGMGIFPELDALRNVPQPLDHHPEWCTFVHTMLVMKEAVKAGLEPHELFAALTHDLGKAVSFNEHGKLHGHEKDGLVPLKAMCDRMKVSNEWRELAEIVCEHHTRVHRCLESKPKSFMKLFEKTDAVRRPDRFESFLKVCEADARGRAGLQDREYPQADLMRDCLKAALEVDAGKVAQFITDRENVRVEVEEKPRRNIGPLIKEAVRVERIDAIRGVVNAHLRDSHE